jgi:hypothetical protein
MQHNVCGMMGQAAVMGWLSKACSGKELTSEELKIVNLEGQEAVSLKKGEIFDPSTDLKNQLIVPPSTCTRETTITNSKSNHHFSFFSSLVVCLDIF